MALGSDGGGLVPIAQISAAEGISDVYAAKLLRQLRLSGLLESVRGAAGGYRLARSADTISVWDAIQALDENFLPGADCDCQPADRVDCRRTTTCAVSSLWRRLGREIRDALEAVSLAELCAGTLDRPDRVELPVVGVTTRRRSTDPNTQDPETAHAPDAWKPDPWKKEPRWSTSP